MTNDTIQQAREQVRQGHCLVEAGAYGDAHRAFVQALVVLRDALGKDHPEVQELVEDLLTVNEMAGVQGFLGTVGLRMPGDLPDLPKRDPS